MAALDVVCLRPEADFARVGVAPPERLRIVYRTPDDPALANLLAGARALVMPAVGPKLAAALFDRAALELVQITGAGVDRLDGAALQQRGIPVANVPGASNAAVAEYVVTTAALLLRRFAWSDHEIRAGRYSACRATTVAANWPGLHGLAVGIVGLGTIGLAVAAALRAFECEVLYHDPAPRDVVAATQLGAVGVTLDDLLVRSDIVTLHVPLTATTQGLIGPAQLARMKPSAILINAARGEVVDAAALAQALGAGRLGGAAIDVYSTEPPPSDHPLLALTGEAAHRVIFTPHIAGVTRQSMAVLFRSAWDNVERVLVRGLPPAHRVF